MGPKRKVGGDIPGPAQTPAGTAAMMAPDGDSSADASVLRGAPGIHTVPPLTPRGSQPKRGRGRSCRKTGRAADASETISASNPDTRSAAAAVAQWEPSQWPSDQPLGETLAGYPLPPEFFVGEPHNEALYQHPENLAGNPPQQAFFVDVPQQPRQPALPAAFMEAPRYVPQHSLSRPPRRPGITAQPQMHASSSPFAGFAQAPVIPGQPAGPGQPQMQQLGSAEEFIILFRTVSAKGIGVMQSLIQDRNRWAAEAQALRHVLPEKKALAEQLIREKAARAQELKADEARFRKELIREKEHLASELRTENARLSDELRTENARLNDELESERRKAETERRTVAALQSKLRLVRRAQARALGIPGTSGESAAAPIDLGSARTGQADADCCCCWACLVEPATVKISPCGHRCLCGPCYDGAFMLLVMEDNDLWCPICEAPASGEE